MSAEELECSQCHKPIPFAERVIHRIPSPFGYQCAWIHEQCRPLRVAAPAAGL